MVSIIYSSSVSTNNKINDDKNTTNPIMKNNTVVARQTTGSITKITKNFHYKRWLVLYSTVSAKDRINYDENHKTFHDER
jgi:hypothetical protein